MSMNPESPARHTPTALLFIAAVAAPLAIFLVVGFFSYGQIKSDAELRVIRTTQVLSEHALRTFRAHDLIVSSVAKYVQGWSWDRIAASRDLHEFLKDFVRDTDDINTVFLAGPDGKQVNTSIGFPSGSMNLSSRDFFEHTRQKDELYISAPDVGRINKQAFFSFTRRRPAPGGSFDGLISVSVNPRYFSNFYEQVAESREDAVALVRGDGEVLVRMPYAQSQSVTPSPALAKAIAENADQGAYTMRSPLDGGERLSAFRRVGNYPLYVVYGLSYSTIWKAWRRNMLPYAVVCLLAMGTLVSAAVLVKNRLRREQLAGEKYAQEAARRVSAEQTSRAKDEFLAALSHELRNPLSSIANAAELLRRQHGANANSRTALDIMTRQMAHLKRLLDDLLDVARINYGKLAIEVKAVDLTQLARSVAADMSASGRAGAVPVSGEPVTVAADPARLRQMIENLLDNARKYGGDRVSVTTRRDAAFAEIAVADDGKGIEPELLPHLFEPFVQGRQTIERAKGGLGLGLALVHKLAGLHGGSLAVESGSQGSVFTIRLPLAGDGAGATSGAGSGAGTLRTRKIMLVEDQKDARESLEAVLKADGHEVQTAADGLEALERLRLYRPDIVLIDIGLPGMNGYELARAIGALPGQDAMLIALTGYGQPEDRMQAQRAGFAAHLIKPVIYEDLDRCLQSVVARR